MFNQKIIAKLLAMMLMLPLSASAASFQDVLDTPAKVSALAAKGLINALAQAGGRIVAVGQRGHILYSDDLGKTWLQAAVPVSSDLVAVNFPTSKLGWAVGHDGVVLHSADGGQHWVKQFDGRMAQKRLVDYYTELDAQGGLGTPESSSKLLAEIKRLADQGAENPLLDVWFADKNTGFVVGAFNLIYRTDDGGQTWQPWFERTENPSRFHLYAIRQLDSGLYIVGEQGLVMKLDKAGTRFVQLDTGYRGTFFGIAGVADAAIVYGLRGHAFRSVDGGEHWSKVETGLQDGITASANCPDSAMILASQSGRVLVSEDAGIHFKQLALERTVPASAVLCIKRAQVLIGGVRGLNIPIQK